MGCCYNHNLNNQYWHKQVLLPLNNTQIDDVDIYYNQYKEIIYEAEYFRRAFSNNFIQFLVFTGGIILKNPSIKPCIECFYWKLSAESQDPSILNEVVIDMKSMNNEYVSINNQKISDEVYDMLVTVNSFIAFIHNYKEKSNQLHIDLIKVKIEFDRIKQTKANSDKKNIIKENHDKLLHLIKAFNYFSELISNFDQDITVALEKINKQENRNSYLKIGKLAQTENMTNAIQIMWEYTKERKVKFYKDYYKIIEDNKVKQESNDYNKTDNFSISPVIKLRKRKSKILELNKIENPKDNLVIQENTDASFHNDINIEIVQKEEEELSKH